MRLAALVEAAIATLRIQAEVKGVGLERDVSPQLPAICGDARQLRRVLLNLIENAIRHTREGGSVLVRAERTCHGVEIEVEDDRDGIPPAERGRVFEPFYGSGRQRAAGRSGLGLAIARAAVEAHGGLIWLAESRRGTLVRLSLPAQDGPDLRIPGGRRVAHLDRGRHVSRHAPVRRSGPGGLLAVPWEALEHWYEENEEVFVHPRDPFVRVDALRSSRHVRVERDGRSRSQTPRSLCSRPVCRPALPERDVDACLLEHSDLQTGCPYKGFASYRDVTIDGRRTRTCSGTTRLPSTRSPGLRGTSRPTASVST